ncbi:Hypothetical protein, putative [Bodo saltans]|uniref:P-type domain-containing protein n=1 Tax=Bodo saltans TaxID=75058 RepID=A0A0S4JFN1_BODSA|nr:Hypothetical protein, putative [Bodo saltans]|eukprot:CUG90296.1 Hypothetical protein, putative [Bodo saltans]
MALSGELTLAGYRCDNCMMVLGAVECDLMTYNPESLGTCNRAACLFHATSASCIADTACYWNATGSKCLRSLCTATTQAMCVIGTSCLWDSFKGSCFTNPCVIYSQDLCVANPMCLWNPTAPGGAGQTLCQIRDCPYTAAECRDAQAPNPLCVWNASSTPQRCQLKQCTSASVAQCLSDAVCRWDLYANPSQCEVNPCPAYFNETVCLNVMMMLPTGVNISQCEYVSGACKRSRCLYTNESACLTDNQCYWQPDKLPNANFSAQCYIRCELKWPEQTQCVALGGSRCLWDGNNQRCKRKCGTYPYDTECTADSYCMYSFNASMLHQTPTCQDRCEYSASNQGDCNADQRCQWDKWVAPSDCSMNCSYYGIYAAQNCTADPICFRVDYPTAAVFNCALKCSLRPNHNTNITVCNNDVECEWNYFNQFCDHRQCDYSQEARCTMNDTVCYWDYTYLPAPKCRKQCPYNALIGQCLNDTSCEWDYTNAVCVVACAYITDMNECAVVQADRCQWSPTGYCYTQCQFAYPSRSFLDACDADKNCEWSWTNNSCVANVCGGTIKTCSNTTTGAICQWQVNDTSTQDLTIAGNNNFTVFNFSTYANCTITNFKSVVPQMNGDVNVLAVIFPCDTSAKCTTQTQVLAAIQANSKACGCSYLHYSAGNNLLWPNFPGAKVGQSPPGGYKVAVGQLFTLYTYDQTRHGYGIELFLQTNCLGACSRACSMYLTTAQCLNPAYTTSCTWDYKYSVCHQKCLYNTVNQSCDSDTYCRWYNFQAQPQCHTRCGDYGYASDVDCMGNPLCAYDYKQQLCVTKCEEHYDPTICASEGYCYWFSDQKCRPLCNTRASTRGDCIAAGADCMWDSLYLSCIQSCAMGYSSTQGTECDNVYMCYFTPWNVCQLDCSYNTTKQSNSVACNYADTTCVFDVYSGTCIPDCPRQTNVTCLAAGMCLYNTSTNQNYPCSRRCEFLRNTSKPICNTDAHCRYDGVLAGCFQQCVQIVNVTDCLGNPTCKMEGSTCKPVCASIDAQQQCIDDTSCEWVTPTPVLDPPCALRCNLYTDKTKCLEQSRCEWTVDGLCEKTCAASYFAALDCYHDARCIWNTITSSCTTKCEAQTNLTRCNADSDVCYVTATSGIAEICISLASYIPVSTLGYVEVYQGTPLDLFSVSYNNSIVINPTSDAPTAMASFRIGGVFNTFRAVIGLGDTCLSCNTLPGVNGARMSEYVQNTSAPVLLPNGTVAVAVCNGSATTIALDITGALFLQLQVNSLGNPICDIGMYANPEVCYNLNSNSSCKTQCQFRYNTAGPCLNDLDCMWDDNYDVCRTTCTELDMTMCLANPNMCEYNTRLDIPCRKRCGILNRVACLADSYCAWDGGLCYKLCEQRAGFAECEQSAHCEWDGSRDDPSGSFGLSCYPKCQERSGQVACSEDPDNRCIWNVQQNMCRQRCELNTAGQVSCLSDSECQWSNSQQLCQTQCVFKYQNSTECLADANCMWDGINKQCTTGCNYITTGALCVANYMCLLQGGSCDRKCPYKHFVEDGCDADVTCSWDNTSMVCDTKCSSASTQLDCQSNYLCSWDITYMNKCNILTANRVACGQGLNPQQCATYGCCYDYDANTTGTPACFVQNPQCSFRCQYRFADQPSCSTDPTCVWNVILGECLTNCTASNQGNCTLNALCQWDNVSSTCGPTCSAKFDSAATCNGQSTGECMWSSFSNQCQQTCSTITNQPDCLNNDLCSYVNGTCFTSCSVKYQFQTDCNLDPICMWNTATGVCGPTCSRFVTSSTCGANPDCEYLTYNSVCTKRCEVYGTIESLCSQDSLCVFLNPINATTGQPTVPADPTCRRLCLFRYVDKASCAADASCMWDPATALCAATCSLNLLSGYSSYSNFEAACESTSNCAIIGSTTSATCELKCQLRYTDVTSCNNDHECNWATDSQLCLEKCDLFSFHDNCVNNPMCSWNINTGVCGYRCPYEYFSNTTCGTDPQCSWDYVAGRCRQNCAVNTNATACAAQSVCLWNTTLGTCVATCESAYSTPNACNNDHSCLWDGTNQICRMNCAIITNMGDCHNLGDLCVVQTSTSTGAQSCQIACRWRWSAESNCTADSANCMWDPSSTQCRPSCQTVGIQQTCNAIYLCAWRSNSGSCQRQCSTITNQTTCQALPFCDFSPLTYACDLNCAEKYPTVTTCDTTNCYWNTVLNQCGLSCARLTSSATCSTASACLWDQSTICSTVAAQRIQCGAVGIGQNDCANLGCCYVADQGPWCFYPQTSCQMRCEVAYITQTDCDASATCQWDTVRGRCSRICSPFTTSTACATGTMCEWNATAQPSPVCQDQCVYRYTDSVSCVQQSGGTCMWDYVNGDCKNDCSRSNVITNLASRLGNCTADITCMYDNTSNLCQARCESQYVALKPCNADKRCVWDGSICRTTCVYQLTSQACTNTGGVCQWATIPSAACILQCPYRWTNSSACNADSTCTWDPKASTCRGACTLQTSTTTCNSISVCTWDIPTAACYAGCTSRTTPTACAGWSACTYRYANNIGCVKACGSQYSSQPSCDGDSWCMWSAATLTCQANCMAYSRTEQPALFVNGLASGVNSLRSACASVSMCVWATNLSTSVNGTCLKACRYRAVTQVSCVPYLDCQWNPTLGVCSRLCSLLNQTDCGTASMCRWSAGNVTSPNTTLNSTCKTRCLYRYTSPEPCGMDPECQWDSVDAKCSDSCLLYGISNDPVGCAANSLCLWNSTTDNVTLKCRPRCQALYPTLSYKPACMQDTGCMWDVINGICSRTCLIIGSSFECTVQQMCAWSINSLSCGFACEQLAQNATGCNRYSRCMWDNSLTRCRRNCTEEGSPTVCAADSMCRWDTSSNLCFVACAYKPSQAQCTADYTCEFNVTGQSYCQTSCFYRWLTSASCEADQYCMWDGTNSLCESTCSRITTAMTCSNNYQCEWPTTSCVRRCQYKYAGNQNGCTADVNCNWNPESAGCDKRCDLINNQVSCAQSPMCQWSMNTCIQRCEFRYTTMGSCNNDTACAWNTVAGRCQSDCNGYNLLINQGATLKNVTDMCNADSFCQYNNGSCVGICNYATAANCTKDSTCMWNAALTECTKTCSQLTGQLDCNVRTMCAWDPNKVSCRKICQFRHTDNVSCTGDTQCLWDSQTTICRAVCSSASSRQDCLANWMCVWDTVNSICQQSCDTYNRSSCTLNPLRCNYQMNLNDSPINGTFPMGCSRLCSALYTTSATCNVDSNCMWDINNNFCTKSCPRYALAEYPNSTSTAVQGLCLSQAMCTVNGNSGPCVMRCNYLYTDENSCTGDSNCMWDTVRYVCTKQCTLISDSLTCSLSPTCEWAQTTVQYGNCSLQCPYRYDVSFACNNDQNCRWDANTSTCQKSCSYYMSFNASQPLCMADSMCFWSTANTCVNSCKAKYLTKVTCSADSGCMWLASTGICYETCNALLTNNLCAALPSNCVWRSMDTPPCKLQCTMRGISTQAMCNAQSDCQWDPSQLICVRACTDYPTDAQCTNAGCSWHNSQTCFKACWMYGSQDVCIADTYCLWNSTSVTCQKRCEASYQTQGPCDADARCMWSVVDTQCRTNCDLNSPSSCALDDMCYVNSFNNCTKKCSLVYNSDATCELDIDCEWDYLRSVCSRRCEALTSQAVCMTYDTCKWAGGKCVQQCVYAYGTYGTCIADPQCTWDSILNRCRDSCEQSTTQTTCQSSSLCLWDSVSKTCGTKCQLKYSTSSACNADFRCMWDTVNNGCIESCNQIFSLPSCQVLLQMCRWSPTALTCDKLCRYRYTTQANCSANPECTWSDQGGCKTTCSYLYQSSQCLADSDCQWSSTTSVCQRRCSASTPQQCAANSNCELDQSGLCNPRCEITHFTQAACGQAAYCIWSPNSNLCVRSCGTYYLMNITTSTQVLSAECTGNYLCRFNSSLTVARQCLPQCQYRYTTEGACETDSECMWDQIAQRCARKCSSLTFAECPSAAMCTWSNVFGSCVEQCQYRFIYPTPCNAVGTQCKWSTTLNQCTPSCSENTNLATCLSDSSCMWYGTTKTCDQRCSYKYNTAAPCNLDSSCMWDSSLGQCKQTCSLNSNSAGCSVDNMCQWRLDNKCYKACQYLYTAKVPCNGDIQCSWDNTNQFCTKSCNLLSQANCASSQGLCSWDAFSNTCRMVCENRNLTICLRDPLCEITWTSVTNTTPTCKEQCTYRYTNPTTCGADPTCMYSDQQSTCVETCALQTVALCTIYGQCEVRDQHVASTNSTVTYCQQKCQFEHTTQPSCVQDDYCTWDTSNTICEKLCPLHVDELDCATSTMCQWAYGQCIYKCEYRWFNASTCNNNNDGCNWNNVSGLCTQKCSSIQDQTTCNSGNNCEWINNVCGEGCQTTYAGDLALCASAAPRCQVNPVSGTCMQSCDKITTSTVCALNSQVCEWNPVTATCGSQCKFASTNSSTCSTIPDCNWNSITQQCYTVCTQISSVAQCSSAAACEVSNGLCVMQCSQYNTTECAADSRCFYNYDSTRGTVGCRKSCSLSYTMQAPCSGDSLCMWNTNNGVCARNCEVYTVAQEPTLIWSQVADLCWADSMCEVPTYANTTCRIRCSYEYTTQPACTGDMHCDWDPDRLRCATQCPLYLGQSSCDTNPMCVWNINATKCEKQCKYRYQTQAACVQSVVCQWNTGSNSCDSSCTTLTTQADCSLNLLCQWDTPATSLGSLTAPGCLKRCSSAYISQTDCNSDARCVWDTAFSVCKSTCVLQSTSSACAGVPSACQWNYQSLNCQMQCSYVASTVAQCTASNVSTRCMWDNSINSCVRRCNQSLSQSDCATNTACTWDSFALVCTTKCDQQTLADCAFDANCLIRSYNIPNVAVGTMCVTIPQIRDLTISQCITDPLLDTMWNAIDQICMSDCRYFNPTDCAANDMCRTYWNATVNATQCTRRCQYKYSTRQQCNMDASCIWDTTRNYCFETCGVITDINMCTSSPLCHRVNGTCSFQCQYKYNATQGAQCSADPSCTVSAQTGLCTGTCSARTIAGNSTVTQSMCAGDSLCRLNTTTADNVTCMSSCNSYGQLVCNADPSCVWDSVINYCYETCALLPSQAQCDEQTNVCDYMEANSQCQLICSIQYPYQDECTASTLCQLRPPCASGIPATVFASPHALDSALRTSASTTWSACGVNYQCARRCSYTNTTLCTSQAPAQRCTIYASGYLGATTPSSSYCDTSCGYKYSTSALCNADSDCQWSYATSTCIASCGRIAYEAWRAGGRSNANATCMATTGCMWLNTSSLCVSDCRSTYTDQQGCNSNANCLWDTFRGVCSMRCSLQATQGACTSAGMCEWHSNTSTCVQQCAYRDPTYPSFANLHLPARCRLSVKLPVRLL